MKNLLLTLFLLLPNVALFASEPVSKSFFGSVAIGGMDSTAYHQLKGRKQHLAAIKGDSRYSVKWKNATWHFASKQSADKFAKDPNRYQPQYNGFCANALSMGEGLISTNGMIWEFFDDQLYLFYAQSGRQRWLKGDWKSYKQRSDSAWLKHSR